MTSTALVAVVSDDDLFGGVLVCALGKAGFDVRRVAPSAVDAMIGLAGMRPRVAVVDVSQLDANASQRLVVLVREHVDDHARLLVLTASDHDDDLTCAFAGGAAGQLTFSASVDELERAVRMLATGWPVVSPSQLRRILRGGDDSRAPMSVLGPGPVTLTRRERQVLRELANGAGTVQIAHSLGIAVPTVRSHVQNILVKLGVHSKLEAAAHAVSARLI